MCTSDWWACYSVAIGMVASFAHPCLTTFSPSTAVLDDSMDSEVELKVSGFFPGELDWMELLKVAKLYPGYYSYAVMKV